MAKQSKAAESWSIDDFLADFRPPERTVPITTRGDLLGELSELEAKLDRLRQAEDDTGVSLAESSEVIEVAEEIAAKRNEVRDSSRPFRVVAIGERRWSDLIAKHPPKGEDKKQGMPWDTESFTPAAISACVAEPQMSTDQAEKLMEVLSGGQIRRLYMAILEVNGGDDSVPKSDASFVLRRASRGKRDTASLAESLDPSSSDE